MKVGCDSPSPGLGHIRAVQVGTGLHDGPCDMYGRTTAGRVLVVWVSKCGKLLYVMLEDGGAYAPEPVGGEGMTRKRAALVVVLSHAQASHDQRLEVHIESAVMRSVHPGSGQRVLVRFRRGQSTG